MDNLDDRIPELVIDADTIMGMVANLVGDMVKVSKQLEDGEVIEDDDELDSWIHIR